jgi:hypothetical protein
MGGAEKVINAWNAEQGRGMARTKNTARSFWRRQVPDTLLLDCLTVAATLLSLTIILLVRGI